MKTIQFIETVQIEVSFDYRLLDKRVYIPRTYLAGEEELVEEMEDYCDGSSRLILADGCTGVFPNECFVVTDWKDENDFGPDQEEDNYGRYYDDDEEEIE